MVRRGFGVACALMASQQAGILGESLSLAPPDMSQLPRRLNNRQCARQPVRPSSAPSQCRGSDFNSRRSRRGADWQEAVDWLTSRLPRAARRLL
ncbi:uncharacterized protein SCHCODRAFT_02640098 [Schizophyllum commune H4-8]|uniref:uncharacterized protein n=1 Tax=Schizophyllum commune (strain H4-8 / FGSC 9210) TaxID=578458 RepID=UPI00215EE8AD|nr:uncharacterized protein SCHCODRAFT_02640098 [Schizophyllum commune H4-8]KAI5886865.1 hypothetical protein SCHCODRAFT_02640098 [Schizophyllum commune H4-8]